MTPDQALAICEHYALEVHAGRRIALARSLPRATFASWSALIDWARSRGLRIVRGELRSTVGLEVCP